MKKPSLLFIILILIIFVAFGFFSLVFHRIKQGSSVWPFKQQAFKGIVLEMIDGTKAVFCEIRGGDWGFRGGLSLEKVCKFPSPSDPRAGQKCVKSSDCLYMCQTNSFDDKIGKCSSGPAGFGCINFLDDEGKPAGRCAD